MFRKKILDYSWEQFEETIRKAIGTNFIWKIRPRDTGANRQAVITSITVFATACPGAHFIYAST